MGVLGPVWWSCAGVAYSPENAKRLARGERCPECERTADIQFGSTPGMAGSLGNRPGSAAKPLRWAADAVAMMREGARLRLDYSTQSLWRVDRMIEEIRREGAPYAAVESVAGVRGVRG